MDQQEILLRVIFYYVPTRPMIKLERLLDRRYGDSFIIANAFREKLDTWPKIPARDGEALRKFADFLRQCERTAMKITGSLHVLNDIREK